MNPDKPAAAADTNFCLDVHSGALFDCLAVLGHPVFLLDVTEREITKQDPAIFRNSGLRLDSATAEELSGVAELRKKYPAPSTPDLIALITCKNRGWILLTGDGHLRKAAELEKVRCHGIIWFLDQLEGKIPAHRLHASLLNIMKAGAYLPLAECHKRLAKWRAP